MNRKLLGLLVGIGTLGGAVYYAARPGTHRLELADAGIVAECAQARRVECTFYPEGRDPETRQFDVAVGCGDDNARILPPAFAQLTEAEKPADLVGGCRDLGPITWAAATFAVPLVSQHSCACGRWPDAGNCRRTDGGWPGYATRLEPGMWTGSDCVRTFCRPLHGDSRMPRACR